MDARGYAMIYGHDDMGIREKGKEDESRENNTEVDHVS